LVNDAGAYEEESSVIPLLGKRKDSNVIIEDAQVVECAE